ncbi:hypothetical protein H9P43_006520 [Blastocladiella emersonii ATCC 22665]|nr:hypothetical protein H9P43_006520 [Blastocladiella emersonii ATCC 22665]
MNAPDTATPGPHRGRHHDADSAALAKAPRHAAHVAQVLADLRYARFWASAEPIVVPGLPQCLVLAQLHPDTAEYWILAWPMLTRFPLGAIDESLAALASAGHTDPPPNLILAVCSPDSTTIYFHVRAGTSLDPFPVLGALLQKSPDDEAEPAVSLQNTRTILRDCLAKQGYDAVVLSRLHVEDADPAGHVACTMPVEQHHLNLNGTLHGGVSATLVDIVGSLAVGALGYSATGVSADIQVSYLAAPRAGDTLRIVADADRMGKTLAFTSVRIMTTDGTLAVRGSHTKYVRGVERRMHAHCTKSLQHARAYLAACVAKGGFNALLLSGLRVETATPAGRVECSMRVEPHHLNLHGALHGGMSATLVDIAGSLSIGALGFATTGVSSDLAVSYLTAAARNGDTLRIVAEADRVGKSLAFTSVRILTEQGELAVRGSHTKYVRGAKRAEEAAE